MKNLSESRADDLERGALFFLHNYFIPYRGDNLFLPERNTARRFLGNWYPRKSMAPNMDEISLLLLAVAAFYAYSHLLGLTPRKKAEEIVSECKDCEFYRERLRATGRPKATNSFIGQASTITRVSRSRRRKSPIRSKKSFEAWNWTCFSGFRRSRFRR